jgi:hypothetical protein
VKNCKENPKDLQFVGTSNSKYFRGQGCALFELTNNEYNIKIRRIGFLGKFQKIFRSLTL